MSPPSNLIALALVVGASLVALPQPGAAGPRDEDLFVRPEDQHTVLFGSLDAGRSAFLSVGAKQTLTAPLDREGFVAMEADGVGYTRERQKTDAGPVSVDRFKHQVVLSGGYQWTLGPVYVAAFLGPEFYQEQVAIDGRLGRLSRPGYGLQSQVELWANPTPETLVTGTAILETVRPSVWARTSLGLKVMDVFVGPELTVYQTPTYRETRWGAHVTGLSVGLVTLRMSAGWMTDDAHRRGSPYAGLSAWIRL